MTDASQPILTFNPDKVRQGVIDAFKSAGVPEKSAAIVADHLVDAELCGVTSHALIRVPQYLGLIENGTIKPEAELSVVHEEGGTAVLDGGSGFGQVMAYSAMEVAIEKANANGVGAVALVNCSHTGRLASYTVQAAERGMIGIMTVNAGGRGQWVAPFGGSERRLGTNPLSIAVPRGKGSDPVFVDIATSAAPEGKIRAMMLAKQSIPDSWLKDHRGEPTTNPGDLYEPAPGGALQTSGGHKGYGLSIMVDLLSGGLSGAGVCCETDAPPDGLTDGVFMIAVRVDAFCALDTFAPIVESLVSHVKSSKPAPGFKEVLHPGELEAVCRKKSLENGIQIEESRWQAIAEGFQKSGVSIDPD